jgi:DNA polymerase III epsilon subunit-like protein
MLGENLLRFDKARKYISLDCESCNLNLLDRANKPWQWAWVEFTLDKVISRKDFYVKWPKLKVSKDAARITGFYQHNIDVNGVDPAVVLEELDKVIYNPEYTLLIHNGLGFDVYLHSIHRREFGKPVDYSYLSRVLDTNALAKAMALGIKPREGESLLAFQYKMTNFVRKGLRSSVQFLCGELDIPHDPKAAHDAKYDVEQLMYIWKKLVWQLEI